ncbi:hypothetical protein WISP_35274 [Willisornis vidua]|uniref:Uncharacterized protein n=1 Tax=Willisornis vidua TaxID=1566151 RepID=A0ABQ9DJE9_9PASS|nr:hypothetical protein WISP_35274 [Willisornis vidua]
MIKVRTALKVIATSTLQQWWGKEDNQSGPDSPATVPNLNYGAQVEDHHRCCSFGNDFQMSWTLFAGVTNFSCSQDGTYTDLHISVSVCVCIHKGRVGIQRDLDRLERGVHANLMKFKKGASHGQGNPKHGHRPGQEWIESSPAENQLEDLAVEIMNLSLQHALAAQKANSLGPPPEETHRSGQVGPEKSTEMIRQVEQFPFEDRLGLHNWEKRMFLRVIQ